MKYVVDRIEEGKAVLEKIDTKEKKIVDVREIPTIMEGDVLCYIEGTYIIDATEKEKRKSALREELNLIKDIDLSNK